MIKVSSKSTDRASITVNVDPPMSTQRTKRIRLKAFWIGLQDSYSMFPTRLPPRIARRYPSNREAILQSLALDWQKIGLDLYTAIQRIEDETGTDEVPEGQETTADCG